MSKAAGLLILDYWVSPFCQRVKIALNEKGLQYEDRHENDLFGGKSELLLNSNPVYQKVPVFLHDGKPVCESTIIVSYIDETWSSPPLLPPCSYGRAQARFWADYIDKKVFDATGNIWRSKEVNVEAKNEFIGILKQLEEALGDKDYFNGATFGFVDIIAIPLTCWFLAVERIGGFTVAEECPKFSSWTKRCLQRESVAKALPDPEKVYEFVLMFRKMQGID
ncbi:hypothetical protein GQ457_05G005570 [Hibiscus cannabinus]